VRLDRIVVLLSDWAYKSISLATLSWRTRIQIHFGYRTRQLIDHPFASSCFPCCLVFSSSASYHKKEFLPLVPHTLASRRRLLLFKNSANVWTTCTDPQTEHFGIAKVTHSQTLYMSFDIIPFVVVLRPTLAEIAFIRRRKAQGSCCSGMRIVRALNSRHTAQGKGQKPNSTNAMGSITPSETSITNQARVRRLIATRNKKRHT